MKPDSGRLLCCNNQNCCCSSASPLCYETLRLSRPSRLRPRPRLGPKKSSNNITTTDLIKLKQAGRGSSSSNLLLFATILSIAIALLVVAFGHRTTQAIILVKTTPTRGGDQLPQNGAQRNAAIRASRQVAAEQSAASLLHQNVNQNVPYKTVYVTRVCEWKSNLFVPKSNDIHFAQPSLPQFELRSGGSQTSTSQQESSVAYETPTGDSTTFRSSFQTDSKALILALPISMSASFAGFEPAQEQMELGDVNAGAGAGAVASGEQPFFSETTLSGGNSFGGGRFPWLQQQPQQRPSLWINVSQNAFTETEHRVIETEGNVLAFRFLLERFAAQMKPSSATSNGGAGEQLRFQVVLTAFQTLSENSDFNAALPNEQFICDQQRLISANLACDGFKNCQDGHDEEPAVCAALGKTSNQPPVRLPPVPGGDLRGSSNLETNQSTDEIWLKKLYKSARDSNSFFGFFAGFFLVVIILTFCSCCLYSIFLLYMRLCAADRAAASSDSASLESPGQRLRRAQQRRAEAAAASKQRQLAQLDDPSESEALAGRQNLENQARQLAARLEPSGEGGQKQAAGLMPPPPRLQSILKRPGGPMISHQVHQERPVDSSPAPQIPSRPRRGALSSSLSSGAQVPMRIPSEPFRPTPARRASRPTAPGEQQSKQQRVSTYHYSSGSTQFSSAYLERLAREQGGNSPSQSTSAHSSLI